jgi:hypothetical protein
MLSAADLTSIARARLRDAKSLFASKRYDGAVYMSGYAVELALKARIVRTLKWAGGFPETPAEFSGLQTFKSHNLDVLLKLTGWQAKIRTKYPVDWARVSQWDPESRYDRTGAVTQADAVEILDAVSRIVEALL